MSTKELSNFKPLHGTDFYRTDEGLKRLLDAVVPKERRSALEGDLVSFSQKVSGPWDELAEETARNYQGPKIERYDRAGNSVDRIWLPPPVRQMRREVVEAGVFHNSSQVEQMVKTYLLGHLGEASVTCPLACTEGLIRSVRAVGSEFLKKHYLPSLLSAETPIAGAQFVTEMDMGSDVGALATRAVPEGKETWRLHGEKWFCSAIDEYFMIAARPEGAPAGTSGVAIFFVPRMIEGRLNNLHIKRLKNKLGTRELPTAEIDLNGALAYNIGPVKDGFKNLMNYILNTSRTMNAAAACGVMHRALLEARNYAGQRTVFGKKMIEYPMVQESLAKMESILSLSRGVYFRLVSELDRNPQKDFGGAEAFWQRFLINLCKYRTAVGATECCHEAILLLGGNGTIETFSILPRLYRDSMILETWEGTHHTLALQIARDGLRFPLKEYLSKHIGKEEGWKEASSMLDRLADPQWVSVHARRLVDRLAALLEVSWSK